MVYECQHCFRTFATSYALKHHISDKHQYEDDEETFQLNVVPNEEPGLWDEDDEDFTTAYTMDEVVIITIMKLI